MGPSLDEVHAAPGAEDLQTIPLRASPSLTWQGIDALCCEIIHFSNDVLQYVVSRILLVPWQRCTNLRFENNTEFF